MSLDNDNWKDDVIRIMGLLSFHKITQQQLADEIDYNKETVYRWLKDPEHFRKKYVIIEHGIKRILEKRENVERR